jgi:branched-chain amino acid transport system ATP-binding protein
VVQAALESEGPVKLEGSRHDVAPPHGIGTSASAAQKPVLSAVGVGIRFGGLKALVDFHLEVYTGDLLALIGPNGAGKTTAFNVLTGVYAPTEGEIRVSGARVNGQRPHAINRLGLARTFQNIRLFRDLSVLDNVKVACRAKSHQPLFPGAARWSIAFSDYYDWWRALLATPRHVAEEREITDDAESLLEVLGLSGHLDERARDLPYGKQKRLEIARALATRPKVLLLDEPAAGMNTREKAELMDLIRELRERFTLGILVIEHDMKLVMGISEKITVLDHGETIAVGTPLEVRANPKVIEAYLGESPATEEAGPR